MKKFICFVAIVLVVVAVATYLGGYWNFDMAKGWFDNLSQTTEPTEPTIRNPNLNNPKPENGYWLRGVWKFNDQIDYLGVPLDIELENPNNKQCQFIQHICFESNGKQYDQMNWNGVSQKYISNFCLTYFEVREDSSDPILAVEPYVGQRWVKESEYKTVDFGDEWQKVEKGFYDWFTNNAVSLWGDTTSGEHLEGGITRPTGPQTMPTAPTEPAEPVPTEPKPSEGYWINGTWKLNDKIEYFGEPETEGSASYCGGMEPITFIMDSYVCQKIGWSRFSVASSTFTGVAVWIHDDYDVGIGQLRPYENGRWMSTKYQTIRFGPEWQEVSEKFYIWFTKNATQIS